MKLGKSHDEEYRIPGVQRIEIKTRTEQGEEKADRVKLRRIRIKGNDKQTINKIAAEIRERKKPERYKGKGIRYRNEEINRKNKSSIAGRST